MFEVSLKTLKTQIFQNDIHKGSKHVLKLMHSLHTNTHHRVDLNLSDKMPRRNIVRTFINHLLIKFIKMQVE